MAAFDGTIIDMYEDPLYGKTIIIDHGDGYVFSYCSLNTLKMVSVGETVEGGQVISAAGNCPAEADVGAHLHLVCRFNERTVDFEDLIDAETADLRE